MSFSVLWLTTRNTVLRDGLLFVLASDCILFCIDLLWTFRFVSFFFLRSVFLSRFVLFWLDLHLMRPTQKKKRHSCDDYLMIDDDVLDLLFEAFAFAFAYHVRFLFSLLSLCFLFSLFLLYSTLHAMGKTWYSLYRSVWDMALFCHIFSVRLPTDLSICLCCPLSTCGQRGKIMMTDWLMMFILWTPVYGPVHSFENISFVHVIYDLFRFRYLGFTVFQLQNLLFTLDSFPR